MTNDPFAMMAAYLEGRLNETQVAELEAWLREDPERARFYIRQAMLDCHLIELHREENIEHIASDLSDDSRFGEVLKALDDPADSVELVDITNRLKYEEASKRAREIEEQRLLAKQYEDEKGRKQIIIPKALFYGGIAAVLLIAVAVLWPKPESSTPDIAHDETTPTTALIVATVTDSTHARWRWGERVVDLPVGSELRQWDRLTLTHGFAELTTARGTTVLLQAPCTFELTDSDNALRLHSGKLVGKCLTPDSKGFVVHVPGMDVIDLGTEFGVQADQSKGSIVLVLDGEVRAEPAFESPKAFEPVVLTKAQARRVKPETGSLEMIAVAQAPAFYDETPHPYVVAVLDAKPVAYWRFEDDAGRSVPNEIETGRNDLQAYGSARLVSNGLIGSASRFDNTDQPDAYFATQGPLEAFDTKGDHAVELWFWIDQALTQETLSGSIGGFADASGTKHHLTHIELQASDTVPEWHPQSIRAHYSDTTYVSGEIHGLFSRTPYAIKQWQHVVLNRTADELQLFLNGVEVGRYPITNDYEIEDALFVLGRHNVMGRWLRQSKIDEVAVYDRTLTAQEINSHFLNYQNEQSID